MPHLRITRGSPIGLVALAAALVTAVATLTPQGVPATAVDEPTSLSARVVDAEEPVKVIDPGYDGPTTSARGQRAEATAAAYPLAQSFALHSSPGSRRTLYLDFDGSAGLGSAWKVGGAQPGWSLDADPAFSAQELNAVQDVWQLVAEDYAPFDVDVTTEEPDDAAITRAGSLDQVYGTRVLVTGSASIRSEADATVCGGSCGGVAWVGVFDLASRHADYQPALVFPEHLGDDRKSIADAASHEAGHTLGLAHDGTVAHDGVPAREYHAGTPLWGPIMGSPYGAPVSQWSRGDYAFASQKEDDLAVAATNGAPLRTDVLANTVGTAAPVPAASGTPAATGVIESAADLDVFALGTCSGTVSAQASPAAGLGPDLDLSLSLLDRDSRVLASADPTAARSSRTVATGLGASVSYTAAPNTVLYARVDGVAGPGYPDYGSLGRYLLSATGCDPTGSGPGAPGSLSAVPAPGGPAGTVDVTWTQPTTGPVAGYTVTLSPGGLIRELPGTATGTVISDLRPGTSYAVSVTARAASGSTSSPATTSVLVPAVAPGAVASLSGSAGADGRALIRWTPPSDDGGASISGYRLTVGSLSEVFDPTVRAVDVGGLEPGASYTATISAFNSAGTGPARSVGFTVPTAQPTTQTPTTQAPTTQAPAPAPAPGPAPTGTTGPTSSPTAGPRDRTALRPRVAPSRTGAPRVGARLGVRPGAWPVRVVVRQRWVLDGRLLPATGRTSVRVPAAWAGRRVGNRLSVSAAGYQPVVRTLSWGRVRR